MRTLFAVAFVFGSSLPLSPAVALQSKASWQMEWEKTVQAAKREGQLNIYINTSQAAVLRAGVFQKTYPEIKIFEVTGNLAAIDQRILAERRAGKFLADVGISGITLIRHDRDLTPIKHALILPEVVDESQWWSGKHLYEDPEGRYIFRYAGNPQTGSISYNTNLVNPTEFQSFWDFLNPKWKGKITATDIRAISAGRGAMRFFYYNPKVGSEFIRRLFGEMDITLFRDLRQGVNWLASGKFSLCFFCFPQDVARAKHQGLPVDNFPPMKEGAGLVSTFNKIWLLNNAPHPNAARVFVNWFLSREGQITLQKTALDPMGWGAEDSFRIDIPKDIVAPFLRRLEGIEYMDLNSPERSDSTPVLKLLAETLAKVGK